MSSEKIWTRAEVAEAAKKGEVYFVIHNNVYSVTKFLDEHPGGHEVLNAVSGKDGSEDFDDVGHSLDAKEMMKTYHVGQIVEHERTQVQRRQNWTTSNEEKQESGFLSSWRLPLILGILATVLYTYLFG